MSSTVVSLFQGYNTFKDAGVSPAVKGEKVNAQGDSTEIKVYVATDMESICKSINISGSASVSYFGSSISDKAGFVKSLNLTAYSISVVVYGKQVSEHLVGTNPEWLNSSKPTSSNLLGFYREYGDSYISEIVKGGEFIGVYTFNSQSEKEQQSIQNELQAQGVFGGISVGADLKMKLLNVCSKTNMSYSFRYKLLGYTAKAFKTSPESGNLSDFITKCFATTAPDSPAVISYTATGYEDINTSAIELFDPIATTRKFFNSLYSSHVIALESVKASCDSISKIYSIYGLSKEFDSGFYFKAKQVKADLDKLKDLFDNMISNPTKTYSLPEISSINYGAPTLNINVNTVYGGGGNGGNSFKDVSYSDILKGTKIAGLAGRGWSWVDNITINYTSNPDKPYKHGGDGGKDYPAIELQPGENIVQVSGAYGTYLTSDDNYGTFVTSLTFQTNKGQTFKYPDSPNNGQKSFNWKQKDNQVFIGFEGRSCVYLDQLNFVVCTFSEAEWKEIFSSLLIKKLMAK